MTTKKNFLKGAMILGSANVLVKIISAFYTIPLARLIGAEGMGLYSCAYQIYLWLFIISATGFPLAISKLVSENVALGRPDQAQRIFKVSLTLLTIIGFCSSLLLYLSAEMLVNTIIGTSKAYLCLVAISPCLFFVSIMSAYRGYFQGLHDMFPTAISQLFEAIIKAGLGLFLAYTFLNEGIEYSSAGAVLGISIGGLGGMLLLLAIYYFTKSRKLKYVNKKIKAYREDEKVKNIITKLLKTAIPITLGASVFTISGVIDLAMIMRRLQEIGFSEDYAIKLYGYLTGYAYKIFSIPTTIVIALTVSIVPAVSSVYINKNSSHIKKIIYTSLKCTLVFSVPAAIGIAVLSDGILEMLFNDSSASKILTVLCVAIVFISTVQVSGAILQGIGKVMIPVKNLFIGASFKIFLNYILIGIPSINILGAAMATSICYIIVTTLNLIEIKNILGVKYRLNDMFFKPLISAACMGIVVFYIYNKFYMLWHNNTLSTLMSILAGILIYALLIVSVKGLNKEDVEMMPWGGKNKLLFYKIKIIKIIKT